MSLEPVYVTLNCNACKLSYKLKTYHIKQVNREHEFACPGCYHTIKRVRCDQGEPTVANVSLIQPAHYVPVYSGKD